MAWKFGPYDVLDLIGHGGMGEVYRARDTRRGRLIALKLLPGGLAGDSDYLARFRREQMVAARLRDPHVVPIHDFGEIDGRLFIDMRLVDGEDLGSLVTREGPLDPGRAVELVSQVALALDSAHADGLVHRDVKPGNVLVAARDFVYVVDFGIAVSIGSRQTALTMTGATVGTLGYMAPERFTHQPLDCRVDIYSLSCVLYECLTGTRPFEGEDLPSMMYAHLNVPPPVPSRLITGIPAALDAVVVRGMAKDPAGRFGTAAELAGAARAALGPDSLVRRAEPTTIVDPAHGQVPAHPAAAGPRPTPLVIGGARPEAAGPGAPRTDAGSVPPLPPPVWAGPSDAEDRDGPAPVPGRGGQSGHGPTSGSGESRRRRAGMLAAVVTAVLAVVVTAWFVLQPGTADLAGGSLPTAASSDTSPARTAAAGPPPVAVQASVPIPAAGSAIDVGATPGFAAVTPDGRFVYVANRGAGVITVVDTTLDQVVATIAIEAGPPQFLTFSPSGDIAYVTVYDADYTVNRVVFLDTATNEVVRTVAVGRRPFAPATSPDGSLLYVPSHEDGLVDVVDTASGELLRQVPTPPNPHWVVFDANGTRYWTADHESGVITAFEAATDQLIQEVPTGLAPHSLALSPDGRTICVVNFESSTLTAVDTATYAVLANVDVGRKPQDVTFAPDGRHLYTANVDGDTVTVVSTATWTVTASIPTGDGPTSVAVLPDGSRAYVSNLEDGTLRVLDIGVG